MFVPRKTQTFSAALLATNGRKRLSITAILSFRTEPVSMKAANELTHVNFGTGKTQDGVWTSCGNLNYSHNPDRRKATRDNQMPNKQLRVGKVIKRNLTQT